MVDVFMKATVGSSGALTLVYNKGVTGVTRNSAGNYTIALKDSFFAQFGAMCSFMGASAPAAPIFRIVTDNSTSNTAPTLIVQFSDASGVATDPASGETIVVRMLFRNAST